MNPRRTPLAGGWELAYQTNLGETRAGGTCRDDETVTKEKACCE